MGGALPLRHSYDFVVRTGTHYFPFAFYSGDRMSFFPVVVLKWTGMLRLFGLYYRKLYNFYGFLSLEIFVEHLVIMQQNMIFSAGSAQ
jgi:hypothetical protein